MITIIQLLPDSRLQLYTDDRVVLVALLFRQSVMILVLLLIVSLNEVSSRLSLHFKNGVENAGTHFKIGY